MKPRITIEGLKNVTKNILAGPRNADGTLIHGVTNPNYFEGVIWACDYWKEHLKRISKLGGAATRANLSPEERKRSASHAANVRWQRNKSEPAGHE